MSRMSNKNYKLVILTIFIVLVFHRTLVARHNVVFELFWSNLSI